MIKVESVTLEDAYTDAASKLKCSVTELTVEVIQSPSKGVLGLFKKNAIIVATKNTTSQTQDSTRKTKESIEEKEIQTVEKQEKKQLHPKQRKETKVKTHTVLNDTIMPASFVSTQEEDDEDEHYEPVYADDFYEEDQHISDAISEVAVEVKKDINELFKLICFDIEPIEVSVYDDKTLLIEFKGEDAALLIGKEGYRYKALSYMLFNWINTKYQVGLRLEIAEFLKNQEEAVSRYLENVRENVDRDGRAQTKILDGVLVQIALRELREIYPDKYVAIRSTRDGLKYIIINDYHTN